MSLINEILTRKEINSAPPVLLDIGASGQIHKNWKKIAPYSICIAFDADDREFGYITKKSSGFKKLHVFNCIVSNKEAEETEFYLTKSPYCSSLLEPDNTALKVWAFAEKFETEKKIKIKNISLKKALEQLNIDRIDWFKTDSQGTDLRLYKSLGVSIIQKNIVAEFEPGIIDSYKGEDKFYELLTFMDKKNFWMSDITIKGSQRISNSDMELVVKGDFTKKLLQYSLKKSPGWAETVYINNFEGQFSIREYLLGWVFATIKKQHGFALLLAQKGSSLFKDEIFNRMKNYSISQIRRNIFKLKFFHAIIEKISKMLKLA